VLSAIANNQTEDTTMKHSTTMNNNNQIDQTPQQTLNARRGFGANPITPADRSPQNEVTTLATKRKSNGPLKGLFTGNWNIIAAL